MAISRWSPSAAHHRDTNGENQTHPGGMPARWIVHHAWARFGDFAFVTNGIVIGRLPAIIPAGIKCSVTS